MARPLTEYQRSLVQSAVHAHELLGLGAPRIDQLPHTQEQAARFFRATHDRMAEVEPARRRRGRAPRTAAKRKGQSRARGKRR